jgi:RHS repeat-associated protein
VLPTGAIGYRHYIRADGATVLYTRWNSGSNLTYYITGDHLGSVASITDASGKVVLNENFSAPGWRRGDNWTGSPTSAELATIDSLTHRGFTGEEMLDDLKFVDLNARVYSSQGNFLSPDPYIVDPTNTQGYNRYAYVSNNPLTHADPTGFFNLGDLLNPFSDENPLNPFGEVGRAIAFAPFKGLEFGRHLGDSILRHNTWLQPIAEIAACYFGTPYGCAAADAYLIRLNGGSIDQALIGGAVTFASYYAYQYAGANIDNWAGLGLADGVIGGSATSLTGGSFKQGFVLAGAFTLANSVYQHYTDHGPGWGPGEDRPGLYADKGAPDSNWYEPAPDYSVPRSFWDVNTFGFNRWLTGDGSLSDCFTQSGACSQIFDKVPGLQGVSQLHDSWMNFFVGNSIGGLNFPTMLPAAAITYGALLDQYYAAPAFLMRRHY